jgi:hypothetical protein
VKNRGFAGFFLQMGVRNGNKGTFPGENWDSPQNYGIPVALDGILNISSLKKVLVI